MDITAMYIPELSDILQFSGFNKRRRGGFTTAITVQNYMYTHIFTRPLRARYFVRVRYCEYINLDRNKNDGETGNSKGLTWHYHHDECKNEAEIYSM